MKHIALGIGSLAVMYLVTLAVAAHSQASLPEGEGKAEVERVCTVCHTLDTVTAKRRTRADWQAVIEDMQTRGALGSDREFVEIVNYLSKNFGPEPSPPAAGNAPAGNAPASNAAGNAPAAGEEKPKATAEAPTKVNVNKATAAELMSQLKLSQESASAIVHYRESNGPIKSWESLKSIPGVDVQQLEQSKDRVEF
jgi:competence protein ComEA